MQKGAEHAEKEGAALHAVVRGSACIADLLWRPQAIFQFFLCALCGPPRALNKPAANRTGRAKSARVVPQGVV